MGERKHYICVTYKIMPEEGKFTAICEELGTATCGDSMDEAIKNINEAILVDLNTLENYGERARFFRERGIRMYSRPVGASRKPLSLRMGEYGTRQNIPVPV
jgi:predicted RNase H-like HicB family nuclease